MRHSRITIRSRVFDEKCTWTPFLRVYTFEVGQSPRVIRIESKRVEVEAFRNSLITVRIILIILSRDVIIFTIRLFRKYSKLFVLYSLPILHLQADIVNFTKR